MAIKKVTKKEYRKIMDTVIPETIFSKFNRKVAEDLKQRTGSYRPGWRTVQDIVVNNINYQCPKCDLIGKHSEMKNHRCSITIDAVLYDVEEKPKLLSPGEEGE